ncbi:hypothetical protein CDEN61S_02502 [Castellaniella denitrificans]|uniref:hypothetical protein n=1 Tax=Castellaniella sp. TaxID=1955812 RepID=UPI002AFF75F8|nr:hypothetical protein [Castellaniella sp.]
MKKTIRIFYFELDTGIYICSEDSPTKIAKELLNHFHTAPPTSATERWGPNRIYAPYGVTLSPIEPANNWEEGKIPVYNQVTETWSMEAVSTPRLFLVAQHCFYSGQPIWPKRPSFCLSRFFEKFPKTSDDAIQAWADFFVSKEGFIHQFKGSGSARSDIKERLSAIASVEKIIYKKWDEKLPSMRFRPSETNPFEYHIYTDIFSYQARRVLDEIASLLFIEIFQPWLKIHHQPIYLDEFSVLIAEPNNLRKLQAQLFKDHKDDQEIASLLLLLQQTFRGNNWSFLESIRTTNNAAKHAFHNSDSRGQLGTAYPTIVALGKPKGKHRKNGLIEYSHSLPQIIVGLEDFLIDLAVRVTDLRDNGTINLNQKFLCDSHTIFKHNDVY